MKSFREYLNESEFNYGGNEMKTFREFIYEGKEKLIATYMRKYINNDKAYYSGHNKIVVFKKYADEVRKDLEDLLSKNMIVSAKGKNAVKEVVFSKTNEMSSDFEEESSIKIPEKE